MKKTTSKNQGLTLIEAIIYSVLLSLLMTAIIRFSYDIHIQNIDLIHDVEDEYSS